MLFDLDVKGSPQASGPKLVALFWDVMGTLGGKV